MKTIYESIFGSRQDIVDTSKSAIEKEALDWLIKRYPNFYYDRESERESEGMVFHWENGELVIDLLKGAVFVDEKSPSATNGHFKWGKVQYFNVKNITIPQDAPEECDWCELRNSIATDLTGLPNVTGRLELDECPGLSSLNGISKEIDGLIINNCPSLSSLSGMKNTKINEYIDIHGWDTELNNMQGIEHSNAPRICLRCYVHSLKGLPRSINNLEIDVNGLTDFSGIPEDVNTLTIRDNSDVPTLKGVPRKLKNFYLSIRGYSNKFISFEGGPDVIENEFKVYFLQDMNVTNFKGIGSAGSVRYWARHAPDMRLLATELKNNIQTSDFKQDTRTQAFKDFNR